jgi:hypothetical protein
MKIPYFTIFIFLREISLSFVNKIEVSWKNRVLKLALKYVF